jgi:TonB family protein
MTPHQLLAEWSRWLWPVFVNHLWQATLLAVAVWIASIWLRRARTRHAAWLMAFAKFLLPSVLLFFLARETGVNLPWPARAEMIAGADAEVLLLIAEPVAQETRPGTGAGHNEIYCVLTALWLIGTALCFARWRRRRRRFTAVAFAGEKVETGREAAMLDDLRIRLNVSRPVGLILSSGFAEPVAGISHAAGSNLKRRIKFMLNANHLSKPSVAGRALAGITFVALVAIAAAMALLSGDGAVNAKAPNAQDQKFAAAAPVRFENLPDIPLVITGARLSVGESRVMTNGGDPDKLPSHLALRGGTARDAEFVVNLVNQGDRRVTAFMIQIQNPAFWADSPLNTMSNPITNSGAPDKQGKVDPQESFTFKTQLPLQDKKDDLDLMNHIHDFTIRITGVKFEADEYWLVAQPGKTPSATRAMMTFAFPTEEVISGTKVIREMTKKESASNQAQIVTGPVQQMTASLRPTILYREKAQYTQEAKDNKIEGTLVLSAVFGADGQIGEINVVRGLPYGLTENAIEAAKKIRFNPAVKDGQPVSVRGSVEFVFRLYDDQIQAMSAALRPAILYKEKAQYTQEAKDNKVAGTVILSAVFGVDGQIGEIEVTQGLPYGLTENAIEAAKKIRFNPAVKDGQPVSVRGSLEFIFNLDK